MKDASLAKRAARGDHEALGVLVRRHRARIQRWALFVVGRAELAEDATQEASLRLQSALAQYDATRSFLPWLRRLVTNVATDVGRRESRRARRVEVPVAASSSREERVDARRGLERANRAFESLSARQREAYIRCEVDGVSTAEVAVEMGIEPATVRALLHQARKKVRTEILAAIGEGR